MEKEQRNKSKPFSIPTLLSALSPYFTWLVILVSLAKTGSENTIPLDFPPSFLLRLSPADAFVRQATDAKL